MGLQLLTAAEDHTGGQKLDILQLPIAWDEAVNPLATRARTKMLVTPSKSAEPAAVAAVAEKQDPLPTEGEAEVIESRVSLLGQRQMPVLQAEHQLRRQLFFLGVMGRRRRRRKTIAIARNKQMRLTLHMTKQTRGKAMLGWVTSLAPPLSG